ncbi:MAG: V-type ATP synthase subunit E [Oscillospiraceae bacterium]|nr:V-type ATP synthase subunit E [Oscillospiraceae bacterium]
MNGLERITSRIEAEARQEIDAILDAGKAEASRIVDSWRAKIDAETRELNTRNAKAAEEREERLKSAAEMDARKTILAAKQEMVEAAYDLALDKLCALSGDEKVKLLADLMARASSTGTEEVVFSAADKADGAKAVEAANAASGKKLTLSGDAAPIRGGFILRDRNVEVNCAFETLVRLQKAETAGEVAKVLFSA